MIAIFGGVIVVGLLLLATQRYLSQPAQKNNCQIKSRESVTWRAVARHQWLPAKEETILFRDDRAHAYFFSRCIQFVISVAPDFSAPSYTRKLPGVPVPKRMSDGFGVVATGSKQRGEKDSARIPLPPLTTT
jgi:hypothetical protein